MTSSQSLDTSSVVLYYDVLSIIFDEIIRLTAAEINTYFYKILDETAEDDDKNCNINDKNCNEYCNINCAAFITLCKTFYESFLLYKKYNERKSVLILNAVRDDSLNGYKNHYFLNISIFNVFYNSFNLCDYIKNHIIKLEYFINCNVFYSNNFALLINNDIYGAKIESCEISQDYIGTTIKDNVSYSILRHVYFYKISDENNKIEFSVQKNELLSYWFRNNVATINFNMNNKITKIGSYDSDKIAGRCYKSEIDMINLFPPNSIPFIRNVIKRTKFLELSEYFEYNNYDDLKLLYDLLREYA